MTGIPFEFQAADSRGYHGEAVWLVSLLNTGKFDQYLTYIGTNYSDMGYPFYLGLLYYILGENLFVPRLIKALISAYTCLLVYKIARNNFGEETGRMAGIMTMLLPNLIYYCGLHVKETEMLFLVVCFVFIADRLIRSRALGLRDIFLLGLAGASLFFFRTVLAGCMIGSVAMATALTSRRITNRSKRIVLLFFLVVGAFFIASTPISDNINEYLDASDQNLKSQMNNFATREDGKNKLARYGSRSIFLPFMVMAPFPTLINIPDQPNAMMLGGAYFTRNVYAFFVFIGLFALYKRKQLREHILILSVIFSYIFVLASSGFALSERFHLPLVPFLLILASYGISQMNQKNKKYYVPYLILISVIIISWNWFKIAGRS
ncbi:glycosyltransferase family 39 protein [Spirosoma aerolatum]|uniref:glycosyltransferase family 39 protein n=1 Tax=Spirosoma aerolatum TaxID=1211326 RepID=UPI001474C4DB|nr:glycosyltransferase family 39 protein [Spirosoma aerolatum]